MFIILITTHRLIFFQTFESKAPKLTDVNIFVKLGRCAFMIQYFKIERRGRERRTKLAWPTMVYLLKIALLSRFHLSATSSTVNEISNCGCKLRNADHATCHDKNSLALFKQNK